jgi:hypothetical protein
MARAGCALSDSGLAEQLDRYRRLGITADSIAQRDLGLVVRFGANVDLGLLEETIVIERGCCGFLTLDYDSSDRRLSIIADDPGRLVALGVLASALRGSASPRPAR